jgi:hypothetical protein
MARPAFVDHIHVARFADALDGEFALNLRDAA